MDKLLCSNALEGLVAVWAAIAILSIPLLGVFRRKLRVTYSRMGFQAPRLLVWNQLWRVELPSVIGFTGPIERLIAGAAMVTLILAVIGVPVALLTGALVTDCPAIPYD